MIKFEYKPWEPERTWGFAEDVPPVEELTMTLGDGVTWQEATDEFHNFLRGAGYVIPYYNVNEADEDDYVDCSDPPELANRMHGPDKWWHQINTEEVEAKRTREQMLMDIREWARDDSNTGVSSEDESNTDVAEVERLRAKKKQIYEDLKSEQTHNTKSELKYDPETGEPLIDGYPLYSGLPNREWVGLTDDDINEAVQFPWHFIPFARAIEAKLKELNT